MSFASHSSLQARGDDEFVRNKYLSSCHCTCCPAKLLYVTLNFLSGIEASVFLFRVTVNGAGCCVRNLLDYKKCSAKHMLVLLKFQSRAMEISKISVPSDRVLH